MAYPRAAPFPNDADTVVLGISAVNAAVPVGAVRRGVQYRVVATQDCWIRFNRAAIAGDVGIFLPAKVIDYFSFGMNDPDGTDLEINVIAAGAGTIYFTPVKLIPTE